MKTATQRGFVLPMALMALALAAIAAFALLQSGAGRLKQAQARERDLTADVAADTALARLSYLIAVSPMSPRALMTPDMPGARSVGDRPPEVLVDGTPYRWSEVAGDAPRVAFALQDEAGLVNVNADDGGAVARLLGVYGVSAVDAKRLSDHLLDFIDADDLRRPNGADGRSYLDAGLPPARNRYLEDPRQAFAALDWRSALDRTVAAQFVRSTAALPPFVRFNPNTAPLDVLQAELDIDRAQAERVRSARTRTLILNTDDLLALSGSNRADLRVGAFPARSIRVEVTVASSASRESSVYAARIETLNPDADEPVALVRLGLPDRRRSREGERTIDDDVVTLPSIFSPYPPR